MLIARRQTLVQLSDELVAALDERAARRGVSRSQLIRTAIEQYIATDEDSEIDRAIVEGYTRIPPGELDAWAEAATIESIRDEPW
jgi:metal-responsive CopG/Arc/MetJ family transcriptional regulator